MVPPKTAMGALSLAWDLGLMIALPIVIFGSIGKYVDGRFGTRPGFTLLGIGLAMVASSTWMYRQIKNLLPKTPSKTPPQT